MALKNKPYRLVLLARVILCKLYQAHVNDEAKQQFSAKEVAALFTSPVSINLAGSALELLRGRGYSSNNPVTRHKNPLTQAYEYKISQDGILLIERGLRQKDSDVSYYFTHGDAAIEEIAGIDAIFATEEDRLDDDPWSPLPIDRGDPLYQTAVQEVESAIEVIRGDNGFAASHPEERAGILGTLENGLQWLKEKAPTRAQITSMLVAPLRWVVAKFGTALIAEASKRAVQALLDYLSLR